MVANIYHNDALSAATSATTSTAAVGGTAVQQLAGEVLLKCPRCDSMNTKFCYYNNYSLAQPRHFCKSCKRYWTRGGTLRNVPIGGSCRKNKRHMKPQSSAVPKSLLRRPANSLLSLTPPATDLSSLIYGLPPISSSNLSFPRFELDAKLARHDETFQSGIGAHLFDVQQSAAVGESYHAPLLSYDDLRMGKCVELGFCTKNPMKAIYSGDVSGMAISAESAYPNWNQTEVSYGFSESSSSAAALL